MSVVEGGPAETVHLSCVETQNQIIFGWAFFMPATLEDGVGRWHFTKIGQQQILHAGVLWRICILQRILVRSVLQSSQKVLLVRMVRKWPCVSVDEKSQAARQRRWANRTDPWHLHGEMKGFSGVSTEERQILHLAADQDKLAVLCSDCLSSSSSQLSAMMSLRSECLLLPMRTESPTLKMVHPQVYFHTASLSCSTGKSSWQNWFVLRRTQCRPPPDETLRIALLLSPPGSC